MHFSAFTPPHPHFCGTWSIVTYISHSPLDILVCLPFCLILILTIIILLYTPQPSVRSLCSNMSQVHNYVNIKKLSPPIFRSRSDAAVYECDGKEIPHSRVQQKQTKTCKCISRKNKFFWIYFYQMKNNLLSAPKIQCA